LLGYLLGALDEPEQEDLRLELERNEGVRRELSHLELRLAPLERLRWEFSPPSNLVASTCAYVAANEPAPPPKLFSPSSRSSEGGHLPTIGRFRFVDVAVAAMILLMGGLLLSPAILSLRDRARLVACQENLRNFGQALPQWAERLQGLLPHIPATGNAGVAGFYAPQLVSAGLMTEHPRYLCPDSALVKTRDDFRVPTMRQVYLAKGAELLRMQRTMGGSYTYGLGYVDLGRLMARRLGSRPYVAVMSDFPDESGNRGGHAKGRLNLLFEDGHVRTVRLMSVAASSNRVQVIRRTSSLDHDWREFFVSDRGLLEAGRSESDIVLAPSWVRPIPVQIASSLFSDSSPIDVDAVLQKIDLQPIDVGSVLHGEKRTSVLPWYLVD
jgi:hypothetical protein